MRNVLAHAGKSVRLHRAAFAQETPEPAGAQWRRADQIRLKVPKLAAILDEAAPT